MSRKLSAVVFLAMLLLVGAMGLKTVVVAQTDNSAIFANGGAPQPRPPVAIMANGGAPQPRPPVANGGAPQPRPPVAN